MKFLLVSPFTNASGSSIRFWNIALGLKKKGHNVVLVERKAPGNKKPIFYSPEINYYVSPSTRNLITDIIFSLVFNLFVFLRHFNCNVFYALKPAPNNCIPALFAKVLKKKIILDIDDLDYAYFKPSLKRTLSKIYFDFFPKFFPIITYHTPNLKKYLNSTVQIPDEKLYYLAQGVSDEFLKVNISTNKIPKSIIYVATLGITSDFGELIPMLARLCSAHPDISISIVGDGVKRSIFELDIKNLGIDKNVKFTGIMDHLELPEFINKHQIGINYMHKTDVNDCRAILKIREYLACGLQVVCNSTGDAELFKEFVHINNSVASMETTIISLLSNKFNVNTNGRQFVKNYFEWNSIITDFLNFIDM